MLHNCPPKIADMTKTCLPNKFFDEQDLACRKEACTHCRDNAGARLNYRVKSWAINIRCPDVLIPSKASKSTSMSPNPSPLLWDISVERAAECVSFQDRCPKAVVDRSKVLQAAYLCHATAQVSFGNCLLILCYGARLVRKLLQGELSY